jgi:HK97 family phage prohead protease
MTDAFLAPAEFKFADKAPAGEFSGYAAVFGNIDSHGDVILPGAFRESLNERKASGRPISMFLMHRVLGGDGLPIGVWRAVEEDARGLRVEGKISGMNTDLGRLRYELVKDGALGELSIGYKVRPNGATFGKGAGQPRRTLTALDLSEISIVNEGSNNLTKIDEIKAAVHDEMKAVLAIGDKDKAVEAVRAALALHNTCLSGGDAPTADERKQMIDVLQSAHQALTGQTYEMKVKPNTIREFEAMLREQLALSNAEARDVAERGFKALKSRDETKGQATVDPEIQSAVERLRGFKLL